VDGCNVGRAWLLCFDFAGLARPGDLRCSGCASVDEGAREENKREKTSSGG
jgi:hypothetical protein